jgi:alkylhydroperoxidase/carboxymuconolactone decarboxylase family protein YurZ
MAWTEELSKRSPALAETLKNDAEFMSKDTALPRWIKFLMAMQMDSIANHPGGARWYASQALETGATEEQLVEAIELLRMFAGRPAIATAASAFEE